MFESVDSGAEAADSQKACESVSPRDTDDFGRRLLHISLPASERLVTSARLPLVFFAQSRTISSAVLRRVRFLTPAKLSAQFFFFLEGGGGMGGLRVSQRVCAAAPATVSQPEERDTSADRGLFRGGPGGRVDCFHADVCIW